MSTGLKKINGAEKVEVSLEQGVAKIQFKPENKVTLAEIVDVVKRSGFSPKTANVKLRGKLRSENNSTYLNITGTKESVPAILNQQRPIDSKKEYWIEGSLKIQEDGPRILTISVVKE